MAKINITVNDKAKELIDKINETKHVDSMDLAKFFGVEQEYKDYLFEQQLKENFETIMDERNYLPKDNIEENGI